MHPAIKSGTIGDAGNKGNIYYIFAMPADIYQGFFISYKAVPKSLRQSLDYSFRKPIFYFSMPCYRLAYARLRIPIPIVIATMTHKHTTV